jgi:hypothetical protein
MYKDKSNKQREIEREAKSVEYREKSKKLREIQRQNASNLLRNREMRQETG